MNPMQILSMLPSLKQNPAAFLQNMGIQLPPNTTDPNAILDYLVRSGRVSQSQIDSMKTSLGISR